VVVIVGSRIRTARPADLVVVEDNVLVVKTSERELRTQNFFFLIQEINYRGRERGVLF
jgi:hypothetical protein